MNWTKTETGFDKLILGNACIVDYGDYFVTYHNYRSAMFEDLEEAVRDAENKSQTYYAAEIGEEA